MYRLRDAESDDFEFLLRLNASAFKRHVIELWGQWDEADQRRRFARSFAEARLQIVEVGGERVGSMRVDFEADPVFLVSLVLAPEVQGRGLGTRLVAFVIRRAQELGRTVRLQVLRPNPAQHWYARLGFVATAESQTHVQMRWDPGPRSEAGLAGALAPWTDEARRDAWLCSAFESSPREHVEFATFVANRAGLPERLDVLDMGCGPGKMLRPLAQLGWRVTGYEPKPSLADAAKRVAQVAGPPMRVEHGGVEHLTEVEAFDLVLALRGPLCHLHDHAQRVRAAQNLIRALRPGGALALDSPNMPWVLRNYREPIPKTVVRHQATISRIIDHRLDFHDGVLEHRDTFVVEVEGQPAQEYQRTDRLSLAGFPAIRDALTDAGFVDIETFAGLDAVQRSKVRGRRIVAVARRPL